MPCSLLNHYSKEELDDLGFHRLCLSINYVFFSTHAPHRASLETLIGPPPIFRHSSTTSLREGKIWTLIEVFEDSYLLKDG
ncbi:hypothetical protein VNO77_00284 [Canavalia gladiata]|uniref:Uncharacterized protein n=1 Tax=Canavalia gladiata TaxID=3824 RepID=A0AAN9MUD1_CANGL